MNDPLPSDPFSRLSEVTKKRLLFMLLAFILLGAAFTLIWIFILNRGLIIVTSKAPYRVEIENIKTFECPEDRCSIEISPGPYTLRIRKSGYQDEVRSIEVPMNGAYEEAITFRFLPLLKEVEEQIEYGETPNNRLSLRRLQGNFRQALYLKNEGSLEPEFITSFIRDLQDPLFSLAPDESKILIADRPEAGATLYLVDREGKTRKLIGNYALVREIRWFQDSQNFLLYGRGENELEDRLFMVSLQNQNEARLDLKTSLQHIVFLDSGALLALTSQDIGIERNPELFEGKPVVLGALRAMVEEEAYVSVIEFTPVDNLARLIKVVPGPIPDAIKLDSDEKGIYLKQKEKNLYLRFLE